MSKAVTEQKEAVRYVVPGFMGRADLPVFADTISARENMKRAIFGKHPDYVPDYRYYLQFTPRIFPDNEARALVNDGGERVQHKEGFRDMFGVNWIFIEVANGSMVEPGKPLLEDMNDWEKTLVWPDIDAWDWAGQQKKSEAFLKENRELALVPVIMSGYFERMISLMDFEGAAMALIDEDQEEAIHAFLDRLADLYCRIIDKFVEYFPVDGICIHDDWGSQRAPFFSPETVRRMLVPHMQKVSGHVHELGLFYDMHCCGKIDELVPAMIEAGADSWSGQPMNDKKGLYHRYGDKLLIGVETPAIPADMPDEEARALARAYVDEFFVPGKPSMIGLNSMIQNPVFYEELHRHIRRRADSKTA